jgi:hypothetical protein
LYKRKKRAYDVLKAKQLCGLAKADLAAFWKRYRKHAEGVNGITSEVLKDGFQQLLQPPAAPATVKSCDKCRYSSPCGLLSTQWY